MELRADHALRVRRVVHGPRAGACHRRNPPGRRREPRARAGAGQAPEKCRDLGSLRTAPRAAAGRSGPGAGAVVIGGDYQGLGIARSLGRHRIPVCVIDDETSIARASRFVRDAIRVRDLRTEAALMDALAQARASVAPGRVGTVPDQGGNRGQHRGQPATHSGSISVCPTPELAVTRHAWDKREVYRLAEVACPSRRPGRGSRVVRQDLAAIEVDGPVVVKPAIKEHFFYATHAKAWRADTAAELPLSSAGRRG